MAQVAGTKNVALAAAVVSLLDRMPSKHRPVGPAELAIAMKMEDYEKVREYIKLDDAPPGILVAVRTWQSGGANPPNTMSLAMREQEVDHPLIGNGNGDA
jgi:hypothetical protein